jgi:hypothetical protein
MFTVRYALSPYIKQTHLVFKGLKDGAMCLLYTPFLIHLPHLEQYNLL